MRRYTCPPESLRRRQAARRCRGWLRSMAGWLSCGRRHQRPDRRFNFNLAGYDSNWEIRKTGMGLVGVGERNAVRCVGEHTNTVQPPPCKMVESNSYLGSVLCHRVGSSTLFLEWKGGVCPLACVRGGHHCSRVAAAWYACAAHQRVRSFVWRPAPTLVFLTEGSLVTPRCKISQIREWVLCGCEVMGGVVEEWWRRRAGVVNRSRWMQMGGTQQIARRFGIWKFQSVGLFHNMRSSSDTRVTGGTSK
jgi:hypothetical protein